MGQALSKYGKTRYPATPRAIDLARADETSDGFQNAHPRDPRLPEAGHPVLRHLDAAGAPAGLARDGRAARRGGPAVSPGASRRDRIRAAFSSRRRWPMRSAAASRWCARRANCRAGRSATPTTSNTAPTRSRCRRTRSRRASASSCSTICSRPAARCRPPIELVRTRGGTVAAAACIIELAFLQGREQARRAARRDDQLRQLTPGTAVSSAPRPFSVSIRSKSIAAPRPGPVGAWT